MLQSAEEVTSWIKTQEQIVILMSAYLAPIKGYLSRCDADASYADDMNGVYQLHTLVQNLDGKLLYSSVKKLDLEPYYPPFMAPQRALVNNVTSQTIPSRRRPREKFLSLIRGSVDAMSEIVVAFAKVPPPPFSATLAAGTPFDGYLLVSRLVASATEYVCIADNYLDASVFDRYLYRVRDAVRVSVRTNTANWKRRGWKEQFEQAEAMFVAQHTNYERADRGDLHARYLITETGGWRIDGSIKDIAVSKDCPIHTITPEEREKVLAELFA
jgi:hypothetical protein